MLPGADGIAGAVIGIGDPQDVYSYAHAAHGLPAGDWQLATPLDEASRATLQLGWGLGSYRSVSYTHLDVYKRQLRTGVAGDAAGGNGPAAQRPSEALLPVVLQLLSLIHI